MFVSFILRAIFIFIRDSLLFTNEEQYLCDYPVTIICFRPVFADPAWNPCFGSKERNYTYWPVGGSNSICFCECVSGGL